KLTAYQHKSYYHLTPDKRLPGREIKPAAAASSPGRRFRLTREGVIGPGPAGVPAPASPGSAAATGPRQLRGTASLPRRCDPLAAGSGHGPTTAARWWAPPRRPPCRRDPPIPDRLCDGASAPGVPTALPRWD